MAKLKMPPGIAAAIKDGKTVILAQRGSKTFYENGVLKQVVLPRINDKPVKLYQIEEIRKRCFYYPFELYHTHLTKLDPAEVYVDVAIVEDYHFSFGIFERSEKLNWFSGDLDNKMEIRWRRSFRNERDYAFSPAKK